MVQKKLFPEIHQPVLRPFPNSRQFPKKHEFVRELTAEIELRGGLTSVRDFETKLTQLKRMRTDLIRLDNEDVGSCAFRLNLHRRLKDAIKKSEFMVSDALELKPQERRLHVYVFHDDFTRMLQRLKHFMVYRTASTFPPLG